MIDDYPKTMKLIENMKARLPIPAHASKPFVRLMRKQGIEMKTSPKLQIVDVLYLGDDGGIACAIKGAGDEKRAIIVSITHLVIEESHPLAKEVRAYQIERTRKLAGR